MRLIGLTNNNFMLQEKLHLHKISPRKKVIFGDYAINRSFQSISSHQELSVLRWLLKSSYLSY